MRKLLCNDLPSSPIKGLVLSLSLGDILIMAEEGFVDGEPDIVGLDDEQQGIVMTALKNKFKYLRRKK